MSTRLTTFQDQLAELSTGAQKQQRHVQMSAGICASQSSGTSGHGIERLFVDLTICTIGKLTININPVGTVQRTTEEVFEDIMKDVDLDIT